MRKLGGPLALASLLALALPTASTAAAILQLEPTPQSKNIGDIVTFQLVISNLDASDEVARFEVDISFDSSLLAPLASTLGVGLGTGPDQFVIENSFSGGVANISQMSFLTELALQGLQGGGFTLATLTFQAVANGFSNLAITQTDGTLVEPPRNRR